MKRRGIGLVSGLLLISLLVVVFFTSACAKPEVVPAPMGEEWPEQIIWGAWPKTAAIYPSCCAEAQLISKYTPSKCLLREYAGGIPGLTALEEGTIDIWPLAYYDLVNAYYGTGPFEGKPMDIRALHGFAFTQLCFGVRPDEGINSVSDLAGKRVAQLVIPWNNELNKYVREFYGVRDTDVKLVTVAGAEGATVDAMIDKTIDAVFGSVRGGWTHQIRESVGLKWLPISEEAAEYATSRVVGTMPFLLRESTKEMQGIPLEEDFLVVAGLAPIAVRSDLPDYIAYGILDGIYAPGHIDEVSMLGPIVEDIREWQEVEGQWPFFIPFHPGAVQYFKDTMIWTEKYEQRQQELLAKP